METQTFDTVVIGAGQAGLAAGYRLRKTGRSFVILDGNERIGDNWRERYDSLRLFTPARFIGLPGSRFPGKGSASPTKDELADYLESYAARFSLPVRTGTRVDRMSRDGGTYVVAAGERRFVAANVIVASGAHRSARIPAISRDIDPSILQLHSTEYRNLSQLRPGGVLVVGAGNSGADIALEAATSHPTWLSGPDRGHVPIDIDTAFAKLVAIRVVVFAGKHILTLRTPIGRKAKTRAASQGDLLVRVKPKQFPAAGIERVPKTVAVRDGRPEMEDGRVLDVENVIWCTGFRHDLSWIDLPIFGEDGAPRHHRGVVTDEPGLAFVGLPFQFSAASDVLPGVGRDAAYVVKRLSRRGRAEPRYDNDRRRAAHVSAVIE
jgi:putative flavoprotein involved in K+ transport